MPWWYPALGTQTSQEGWTVGRLIYNTVGGADDAEQLQAMLSLRKYMTLSVVAASAVIYHAFATRRQ